MASQQWRSTNKIRAVGIYETVAGAIGVALSTYELLTTDHAQITNVFGWVLSTFPMLNLLAGILVLLRITTGLYLSLCLQAVQVVQFAVPGFAIALMCGLTVRLLVLPRFGPEVGYHWLTQASVGDSSEVFVGVNLIPAVLIYFLTQAPPLASKRAGENSEGAA